MAKKKAAPAKKVPTKSVKKAAVKKAPAKKTASKPQAKRGPGRPKGSVYVAKGFDLRDSQTFARADHPQEVDGYRWIKIQVGTPEDAVLLKKIAKLITSKNDSLIRLAKKV